MKHIFSLWEQMKQLHDDLSAFTETIKESQGEMSKLSSKLDDMGANVANKVADIGSSLSAQQAKSLEEQKAALAKASSSPTELFNTADVRLGIKNAREAAQAFKEIRANAKAYNPKAKLEGVLVEEMIGDAAQVIVGFKQDPRFGPVVTFGMGGIFVELIRDFALRVVPLDAEEALAMIKDTKAYPLLTGFRGTERRDIAALSKVILAVSQLAQDFKEELAELDINPVMVLPEGKGVRAVDALLVLRNDSA